MAAEVIVGAARPEEAGALGQLFYQDMDALGVRHELSRHVEVARQVIARAAADDPPTCVLRVARLSADGPPIGVLLANYTWSLEFAGRSLWIEALYVDPSARRAGVGRALVQDLLEYAVAEGVPGIDIEAYRGNTPASVLYRTMGFRRLGRERFWWPLEDA